MFSAGYDIGDLPSEAPAEEPIERPPQGEAARPLEEVIERPPEDAAADPPEEAVERPPQDEAADPPEEAVERPPQDEAADPPEEAVERRPRTRPRTRPRRRSRTRSRRRSRRSTCSRRCRWPRSTGTRSAAGSSSRWPATCGSPRPQHKLGMPPARLGLVYSHTGLRRFLDAIGAPRTRELFLLARNVDAATALEWGLVNRLAPAAELPEAAVGLAATIAANAPLSLRGNKRAIRALLAAHGALEPDVERALVTERAACFASEDFREGVRAFAEKRSPRWQGR